jgi:uncharacterized membrane protein YqjE
MAFSERAPLATPQARDALNRLIDGFQTLVREHLALAKVELKEDLRRMGRSLLLSAAGAPALLAGYLFLNAAIALLLATVIASWAAFGIVAIVNLVLGAALTAYFVKKARETPISLSSTSAELRRDREMLSSLANGAPAEPRGAAAEPAAEIREQQRPPERSAAPVRPSWTPAARSGGDGASRAGQPAASATSTPKGEPVTATRGNLAH